jgi:hypothetical protein
MRLILRAGEDEEEARQLPRRRDHHGEPLCVASCLESPVQGRPVVQPSNSTRTEGSHSPLLTLSLYMLHQSGYSTATQHVTMLVSMTDVDFADVRREGGRFGRKEGKVILVDAHLAEVS